jgi:hypothetical protein
VIIESRSEEVSDKSKSFSVALISPEVMLVLPGLFLQPFKTIIPHKKVIRNNDELFFIACIFKD